MRLVFTSFCITWLIALTNPSYAQTAKQSAECLMFSEYLIRFTTKSEPGADLSSFKKIRKQAATHVQNKRPNDYTKYIDRAAGKVKRQIESLRSQKASDRYFYKMGRKCASYKY